MKFCIEQILNIEHHRETELEYLMNMCNGITVFIIADRWYASLQLAIYHIECVQFEFNDLRLAINQQTIRLITLKSRVEQFNIQICNFCQCFFLSMFT